MWIDWLDEGDRREAVDWPGGGIPFVLLASPSGTRADKEPPFDSVAELETGCGSSAGSSSVIVTVGVG